MAMGQRGQQEAVSAFRRQVRYISSGGNLTATPGSARNLGGLHSHPQADYIKDLLSRAEYVVWSYQTPIGFVSLDDGEVQRFIVDVKHTDITSHHQGLLQIAWDEYEVICQRPGRTRVRRQPPRPYVPPVEAPGSGPSPDRMHIDFSAQDELMDEVRGWRSPSHP